MTSENSKSLQNSEDSQHFQNEIIQFLKKSISPDNPYFNAEEWADLWMNTQIPALGWKTPKEFATTPENQKIVLNILGSLFSGSYQ